MVLLATVMRREERWGWVWHCDMTPSEWHELITHHNLTLRVTRLSWLDIIFHHVYHNIGDVQKNTINSTNISVCLLSCAMRGIRLRLLDSERVLMWRVWHVIIAIPRAVTLTCDSDGAQGDTGPHDTWHHATLTISWFRSENTLNGNIYSRYLNPLTPHWASAHSAPNKTISDVSSGWSYHRLKGDNWDHNPTSALWKPQCLRAELARLILCCVCQSHLVSEHQETQSSAPVPDLAEWVTAEWQVSKWPVTRVIDGGVGSSWAGVTHRGALPPLSLCHM